MRKLDRGQVAKRVGAGSLCLLFGFLLYWADLKRTTVDVRTPAIIVQPLTERPVAERPGPPAPVRHESQLEEKLQQKGPLTIGRAKKGASPGPLSSTSYVYFPGWSDVVKSFLNKGGNPNHRIDGGETETLLQHAAILGDAELTRLIIEKGADPNARNDLGNTALHFAAYYAKPEIVTLLISHGAAVNAKNSRGETPLHFAAKESSEDKWLRPRIQASLSQETWLLTQQPPKRISEAHVKVARLLLRHGAKVNAMSYIGGTPDSNAKRRCNAIAKPKPHLSAQWDLEKNLCNELLQALRGNPGSDTKRDLAGF